jgi:small subunit ribosomal protein S5
MSAGTSERSERGQRSERGPRGPRGDRSERSERVEGELSESIVKIKRCAAVVKGGRRFSFAAMVVVGDGKGKVGWGYGKANEVPPSVEKARKEGMRSMVSVTLDGKSISHVVKGHYGAAHVILLPASPGAGVIAGSAVRAVCEAAGIHDILTKSFGSNNPVSLVKATFAALQQLRPKSDVERLRQVTLS